MYSPMKSISKFSKYNINEFEDENDIDSSYEDDGDVDIEDDSMTIDSF